MAHRDADRRAREFGAPGGPAEIEQGNVVATVMRGRDEIAERPLADADFDHVIVAAVNVYTAAGAMRNSSASIMGLLVGEELVELAHPRSTRWGCRHCSGRFAAG